LWLRFAVLWLAVVLVGLVILGASYGVWWFAGALLLVIAGILFITPKWLR
jgi:hypothetical protein